MERERPPARPEWSEELFNRIADFLKKIEDQRAELWLEINPVVRDSLWGVSKPNREKNADDMSLLRLRVQAGLEKAKKDIPVNDWGVRRREDDISLLSSALKIIEAHDTAYAQLLSALHERSLLLPLDVLQAREALDYQDFKRAQALPYPLDEQNESFLARRTHLAAVEETGSRWRRSNAVLNLAISRR